MGTSPLGIGLKLTRLHRSAPDADFIAPIVLESVFNQGHLMIKQIIDERVILPPLLG